VRIIRENAASAVPTVSTYLSGLRVPHDIVFTKIARKNYVFISESHQIVRYEYVDGQITPGARRVIVGNLPDSSTPELGGAYGHALKNFAIGPDGKLYVAIASASNASPSDATSDPVRCAVYRYNLDGTGRTLFARGLRNAEGVAFAPKTSDLWVVVNGRDNIRYPYNDSTGWYGKVISQYVDNHPADLFTRVYEGANLGWPFANPNSDTLNGFDQMPLDPDYDNNRDWSKFTRDQFTPTSRGIPAHSAPLGLTFLQNTAIPAPFREGALVSLHGSWNRTRRTGYKVVFFPWYNPTKQPLGQYDFVTGWLDDLSQNVWGRPVDAAVDARGRVYVSDDQSGTIYRFTYQPPTGTGRLTVRSNASPTAVNLTDVGNVDWAAFPRGERKSSGGQISPYALIGLTNAQSYVNPRTISWKDGTNQINGQSTASVATFGVANGFAFTVPVTTTARTIRVYLTLDPGTTGKVVGHLSDGSAADSSRTVNTAKGRNVVMTFVASSAQAGQTLSVRWTQTSPEGKVALQAVAVSN
jgi:glucose/arabinose dehydrogenase